MRIKTRHPVAASIIAAVAVVTMAAPAAAVTYIKVADASYGGLSENGTHLVFSTSAKLVANDTNTLEDLYTKDLGTGTVRLISSNDAGGAVGTTAGTYQNIGDTRSISSDGRYAAFTSSAAGVVSGVLSGVAHVYRKDLVTGEVVLLDKNGSTPGTENVTDVGGISTSGDKIAFLTNSALVGADANAYKDAYIWQSSGVTLVSTSTTGAALGSVSDVRLAADGGFALYSRLATPPATGWNLYRRNLATGATETMSTKVQLGEFAISANGATVAFTTNEPLVASDTEGADVYVRTSTGVYQRVTVPVPSMTQPSTRTLRIGNVSSDGAYVSLITNAKLAAGAATATSAFSAYKVNVATGAAQVIAPSTSTPTTLSYTVAMSGAATTMVIESSFDLWAVNL